MCPHLSVRKGSLRFVLFFLLVVCTLLGCAGPSVKHARIIWPLPPHPPQLEFIASISSADSFARPTLLTKTRRLFFGAAPAYFDRPFAVAADTDGRVLVTDSVRRTVSVLDLDRGKVTPFAKGFAFKRPMGIAVDSDGRVYVADGLLRRICVFDMKGVPLTTIGDDRSLFNPSFIEIDAERQRLYVADAAIHTVSVFSLTGELLLTIGGKGDAPGQFFMPQGMAINRAGYLMVADLLNSRIQLFDQNGQFSGTFGAAGSDYWNLEHPRDLAIDERCDIYLVDYRKALLNGYFGNGDLRVAVGRNLSSRNILAFGAPTSLCIDRRQRIFVTDTVNKRISVWQILTDDYLRDHELTEKDLETIGVPIKSYKTRIGDKEAVQ